MTLITNIVQISLLIVFILINISLSLAVKEKKSPHDYHQAFPSKSHDAKLENLVLPKLTVPNLPVKHYQYWLRNNPYSYSQFKHLCSQAKNPDEIDDPQYFQSLHINFTFEDEIYLKNHNYGKRILGSICSIIDEVPKSCWGYENNCQNIYLMPDCHGSSLGQAKTNQEHKILWFNQADFGYILEKRREMNRYCILDKQSNETVKSSFDCTKKFGTCRGENIMMNIKSILHRQDALTQAKPLNELIRPTDIGGWNCDLQVKRISEESGQEGELQSWFNELKNYHLLANQSPEKACEEFVDKPVYFVKQDSITNLYHYMSTFLNLYMTMHLNNRFFEDNKIIVWDSKPLIPSKFDLMWSAFSSNKPVSLADYKGKRVCFEKFIFTLPPRMINGLYYNTPLVSGCKKSGLFDAFNKHVTHKLKIPNYYNSNTHVSSNNSLVRIVILKRSTPSRVVLNEQELEDALSRKQVKVKIWDYAELEFQSSIAITLNADILIGMHGAGLTNLLFLPDWASVVELYDCGDKAYFDLARLRGVDYFTMTNNEDKMVVNKVPIEGSGKSELTDDKMANYTINVDAFLDVVDDAVKKMKNRRLKHFEKMGVNLGHGSEATQPKVKPSPHVEL